MQRRPNFTEIKTFAEFSKYYWYREELIQICKDLGICSRGYKAELNRNIEEYFKGNSVKASSSHRPRQSKNADFPLSLQTGLLECSFCFNQHFRNFFSAQTGIKNFKFSVDMVASARKVKETGDTSFTLGDLLDIFYGRKTYAHYDKVSLQWNKFVKDFYSDPATSNFPDRLKAAARLWKQVRESTREKVYKHELLEELMNQK